MKKHYVREGDGMNTNDFLEQLNALGIETYKLFICEDGACES